MERAGALPEKIGLAMRAASLSRVALAAALGVDKSLIGRWISGAVHPTEHNLARLTTVIAATRPGFCLGDWFLDSPEFAQKLGLPAPAAPSENDAELLPILGPFLARSREETVRRGSAYEGFWRTSRPSLLMTDRIFHDYGMIRRTANGLLEVRMKGAGLSFSGWMMPGEGNLFVFLQDPVGMTPMTLVFKGVSLPRAMVLDGLLMLAALDAGRTLGALPILLERVGDLSGDADADELRCDEMARDEPEPLEPLGADLIEAHIFRGSGPSLSGNGNDLFLSVHAERCLSRGSTQAGLSG